MSSTEATVQSPRRQWGAERRSEPLSIIHPRPTRGTITWGRIAIVVTIFLVVVTFLTFSALMYLVARQGALYRFRDHQRAALQEYPDLRIVLLVDDPPTPTDPEVLAMLTTTRALAADISASLEEPAQRFRGSLREAEQRLAGSEAGCEDARLLAAEYRAAADWLTVMAEAERVVDHVSEFFVDQVLMGLASELRLTVLALDAAVDQGTSPDAKRIVELHGRLAWIFTASLGTFERKSWASLSHEANKAMNINAYLSLMGDLASGRHRGRRDPRARRRR